MTKVYSIYKETRYYKVCEEIHLLEVEVPLIFCGTGGFA